MSNDRYKNHNELVNKVLLYVHANFTGRYWSNPTGAVKTKSGHFQRYGMKGSTDIIGFTGQGRAVFIEIKTGTGCLSVDQSNFKKIVEKNGCIHVVVRENFEECLENIGLIRR